MNLKSQMKDYLNYILATISHKVEFKFVPGPKSVVDLGAESSSACPDSVSSQKLRT